jgi:hypothetical protein
MILNFSGLGTQNDLQFASLPRRLSFIDVRTFQSDHRNALQEITASRVPRQINHIQPRAKEG